MYAPIIYVGIFALEGILAAVALIVNTDKCRLVCRIIIIILGVVFALSLSYAGTSFIGLGEQIYSKIGAGSAEAGTKNVVVMLLVLASFFGPLILQIATLGFMLLTFEQEGGMNVATWFLFTVPGAGFVIAIIFLFKNLFAHGGGNGYDGNAEALFKLFRVDFVARFVYGVHHVQSDYDGNVYFEYLSSEIEVAFEVGRVDDVDYAVGFFVENVVSCDYFFRSVRSKRVNARQVNDGNVFGTFFVNAVALIHCNARPVADVRRGPGKGVKKRCFSAVGVAR